MDTGFGEHGGLGGALTLAFRDAEAADVPAIVTLVDSAYRGESSRAGWTHEADVLEGSRTDPGAVAEIIADPASRVLVAEAAGALGGAPAPDVPGAPAAILGAQAAGGLVGCCHLEFHDDYAYFGMFAIRPDRQAAGLGRAVLAEAERRARATEGVRQLRMTVLTVREELIAYYVRRGYRRTGELTPFPYGDDRFGVPQRPDLRFELLVKDLAENRTMGDNPDGTVSGVV